MKITKCSSTIRSHGEITYLGLACSDSSWPIKALITMTGKSQHSYTLYRVYSPATKQNNGCFIQLVGRCLVSSRSNCKSFSELLFQAGDSSPWLCMGPPGVGCSGKVCSLQSASCVGSLQFPECRQRCEHYMLQILNHYSHTQSFSFVITTSSTKICK